MIEHTLSLLDSPASLEAYLVKEGRCHLGLEGIQSQYFNVIGPLLFSAIAPYILVSITEYLIRVSDLHQIYFFRKKCVVFFYDLMHIVVHQ